MNKFQVMLMTAMGVLSVTLIAFIIAFKCGEIYFRNQSAQVSIHGGQYGLELPVGALHTPYQQPYTQRTSN